MPNLMPASAQAVGCLVAIDPGTESLGVARFYVEVPELRILSSTAQTFRGSKLGMSAWTAEAQSPQFARIEAHHSNLLSYLFAYQPFLVVSEAPFFSRKFPMAFAALVRTVSAVQQAVNDYRSTMSLHLIDPPTIKNAVGAAGNAGKTDMRTAVLGLPDLQYSGDVALAQLDEHSVDALAVGYCKIRQLREGK